jgi:prophage DNA circulation protein
MVKNIQELQAKLDKVNESGLIFLSNRVLSKLPAIRETKEATISRDEVLEVVDNTFMNYLKTSKGIEDIELLTEKEINKMFNEMATSMGKSRRYKFITKTNINGTSKLMYNISSAVKRDLAKEYGITVKTHYGEDNIIL